MPLVIVSPVKAVDIVSQTTTKYNVDYSEITRNLLSVRGIKTTKNDLYFLACTVRKHLERKEDPNGILNLYPQTKLLATPAQIKLVKDVINNNTNRCYDVYLALSLSMLSSYDSDNLIAVISNTIAFIDYDTYIKMTVRPNL